MRRTLLFLLLAATATSPLAAQAWNGQARPDRGDQQRDGPGDQRRGDRPDRAGDPRANVQPGRQLAQRDDGRRDDGRRDDGRNDRGDRDDRSANRPGYGRDGWGDARQGYGRDGWRNDGQNGRRDGRNDRNQAWNDGRGRNDGRGGGWNNQWRGDRRYDWQGYRASNRSLYRAPRYYGPRGYDYSRWSRGYRVQPYFYGQSYWINDPYRYRLPPAYGSYRWVRYYDDVALIDIRSGLIEDIIYSFFWR